MLIKIGESEQNGTIWLRVFRIRYKLQVQVHFINLTDTKC